MTTPVIEEPEAAALVSWIGRDGRPVACREKLKVLEENRAEVATVLRDAFDDAVIMGVDPEAMRAVLAAMVAALKGPNRP